MRVGALDLSSKTGHAAWNGTAERPVLGTKTLVGWQYDVGTMLEFWRRWLGDWIRTHQPEYVAVEAPFIPDHGGGDVILKQAGLFAFTMWAFKSANIRAEQVHSASWRKHFIGCGMLDRRDSRVQRGEKPGEAMKRLAVMRARALGWDFPDHNAAEAGGILTWAINERLQLAAPWRDQGLLEAAE